MKTDKRPTSHTIDHTALSDGDKLRKLALGEYWDEYDVYWANAYDRCNLLDAGGMERDSALTAERMPTVRMHVIQQIDANNAWM